MGFMMLVSEKMSLSVPSQPASVASVTEQLESFCEKLELPDGEIHNMMIAVDEAVTNIVTHAYPETNDGIINVHFQFHDEWLKVELQDHGKPFSMEDMPTERPDFDLEGEKLGGFGLFLMQHLVDTLSFEHDDVAKVNRLVMKKRIAPGKTSR